MHERVLKKMMAGWSARNEERRLGSVYLILEDAITGVQHARPRLQLY